MPPKANIKEIEELYQGYSKRKHYRNESGQGLQHIMFVQWNMEPKPEEIYTEAKGVCALIYQKEICPTSEQEHYQGYMQFDPKKRFELIYKWNPIRYFIETLNPKTRQIEPKEIAKPKKPRRGENYHYTEGAFLTVCRGTAEQNIEYAKKERTRAPDSKGYKRGVFRMQSGADTYQRLVRVANGTFDPYETVDDLIFAGRNTKVINEIKRLKLEKEVRSRDYSNTKLRILFGVSGAGKTHDARYGIWEGKKKVGENLENTDWFQPSDYFVGNGQPLFDGYNGQRRLILDEFDKHSKINIAWLIDACSAQVIPCACRKEEPKPRGWTEIFIIMNTDPDKFFARFPESDALIRRISGSKRYEARFSQEIEGLASRTWQDIMDEADEEPKKAKKNKRRKQKLTSDEENDGIVSIEEYDADE